MNVVLLTPDELEKLIKSAVESALAEQSPVQHPALLTKSRLATELGCSVKNIERLIRDKGLPVVRVGESPRFDLDEVRAWLGSKNGKKR
jgi:excisionase family DNA binding protein